MKKISLTQGMCALVSDEDYARVSDTVVIRTPANRLVAWVCSQEDMLAEDWGIL